MSAVTPSETLTVGVVSELVGVSVRTLHHWDQIGLVPPTSRTSAGYRSYTVEDVGRIHRVLVYRKLGFGLSAITELLDDPDVDEVQHLREQQRLLRTQIAELQRTAEAVDQVLAQKEAGVTLTAQEQAEIFGRGWRQDWADEAQERWGESEQWKQFEANAAAFTADERFVVQQTGEALHKEMAEAKRSGVLSSSPEAVALAERHRAMIGALYTCTPSMHALLGRMYVEDPRFRGTIDTTEPGLSVWLRDAIYAAARAHGIDPAAAVWA